MRTLLFLASAICVILFSGCGTIDSRVTSFHTLGGVTNFVGSVFIEPEEGVKRGIEFDQYAAMVQRGLAKHGFFEASSPSAAKYILSLSYSIDTGKTHTSSTPIYGQTGGGRTTFSGNTYGAGGNRSFSGTANTQPTFGVVGTSVGSSEVFTRAVTFRLSDKQTGKPVWECRNTSSGYSNNLPEVLPTLIEAMLKEFPGPTGKTRTVSLPIP